MGAEAVCTRETATSGVCVLIVEDNRDLADLMAEHLLAEGFAVRLAGEATAALEWIAAGGIDVVLLDLMLPRVSGDGLLTRLRARAETRDLPVIVVSAKDTVWAKVDLLRLGADDYLTKPFDLDELTARIQALLRRSRPVDDEPAVLRHGALVVEPASRRVRVDEREVALTPAEFDILRALISTPGQVASRASLARAMGEEPTTGAAGVKTHVSHLRAKLRTADPETEYIDTVWGLGYRMAAG